MRLNSAKLLIPAQVAIAIIAVVALAMWPPASGRMLLVQLTSADTNRVARVALAGNALLLGTGPFPGSMVVVGVRANIAHQIKTWKIVILAAPSAGCGANAPTAD